jgi:hypothetical protein
VLGGRCGGSWPAAVHPEVGFSSAALVSTDGAAALAAWTMGWRPDDDGVGVMRTDLMLPDGGICRVLDGLDLGSVGPIAQRPRQSASARRLTLGGSARSARRCWLDLAGACAGGSSRPGSLRGSADVMLQPDGMS